MLRPLASPPPPSPLLIWRLGNALLGLGLGAVLVAAIALAWLAPEWVWIVPVGLAGLVGAWALLRDPVVGTYAAIAISVIALTKGDGFTPNQVLYGLFLYTFFGVWYGGRVLQGRSFIHSGLDRAVAVLLFVGFPLAAALGLALGAPATYVRGEVISVSMLGYYFPVKEVCRQQKRGSEIVLALVLSMGVFVAVRNLASAQQVLASATEAWQIADARLGLGTLFHEMHLLFGAIGALAVFAYATGWRSRTAAGAVFALCTVALLLTKSRGYWVDLALGIAVLGIALRGRERWRLGLLLGGGSVALGAALLAVLGPAAVLVLDGTLDRLLTIGTATTEDLSLLNRFREAVAVVEKGRFSPVLGWGLGADFVFYDLVTEATLQVEFIHNGYVAVWFKLGIWGVVLLLGSWLSAAWQGLQVHTWQQVPRPHRAAALAAGVCLLALAPSISTSSPFFMRDLFYLIAIQMGVAAGLHQRYAPVSRDLLAHEGSGG